MKSVGLQKGSWMLLLKGLNVLMEGSIVFYGLTSILLCHF